MTSTKNNGGDIITEKYISLSDLRKVKGIGDKTIERIKAQLPQSELDNNYKSEYNPHIKLDVNEIYQGDCLELMNGIPDKSVDMILCDLPYGTTNRNKWDIIIPFDKLWKQYKRIIKDNGAILLFADEPFTSELICSNKKWFKQRITWDKDRGSGFLNAKRMLLKQTEDIVLFYNKQPTYNPQMVEAQPDRIRPISDKSTESMNYGKVKKVKAGNDYNPQLRYPTNLIKFSSVKGECNNLKRLHPTQKPVELCEWLIKTYSNEGELVLDNCIGLGTTAIACINTNRNYIGIELDENYYNIAKNRIYEHKKVAEKSQKCSKYEK